jgi:hypothetical protein
MQEDKFVTPIFYSLDLQCSLEGILPLVSSIQLQNVLYI